MKLFSGGSFHETFLMNTGKKTPVAFDRGRYYQHAPSLCHAALVGAGEIRHQRHRCQRRTLNDLALVYVVAGSGWFAQAGGTAQPVRAGDVLILLPGIEHAYGPTVPGQWDEYWLMCSGAVFTGLQATGLIDAQQTLWHPGVDTALIRRFDALVTARLTAAQQSRPAAVAMAMEARLAAETHLLITLLAEANVAGAAHVPAWLATACAALDADLARPLNLQALARSCGFTYDTFRKSFTAEVQTSPARYRLERRIERAKAMLTAGNTPGQVAAVLGFCDVYYFSRQFRQVTATTPGRFRGTSAMRAPRANSTSTRR